MFMCSLHASLSLVRVPAIIKNGFVHLSALASMIAPVSTHTTSGAKAPLGSRQRQSDGEVSALRIVSHSTEGQPGYID